METYDKIVEQQLLSMSNETEVKKTENDKEEEDEEALSLCDLPIEEEIIQSRKQTFQENKSIQDGFDFDFCSFSKDSFMCSADQVFFQGQILPFRHLSRSNSMDNLYSNGFTSGGSSRSSSIRSHQSSTSTASSTKTTPIYKPRVRNNFNSHQGPKQNIKDSRINNQNMPNCTQKSTMWNLFRLGLITTQEIVLEDLKHRSINNNTKISQNSKSFGTLNIKSEKKKKHEVNGPLFSTCKCSSNAVVLVNSKIGKIKRNVNVKDTFTHEERKGTKQQQEGKQAISRHRTFEWLKQLSLDSTSSV